MNNIDKITSLLAGGRLSDDRRKELEAILQSDPEARSYYNTYIAVQHSMRHEGHIEPGVLNEYVLYKHGAGDPDTEKEFAVKVPEIDKHLSVCRLCSDEFKMLSREFADAGDFVAGIISGDQNSASKRYSDNAPLLRGNIPVKKYNMSRYSWVTLFIVALCTGILIAVSFINSPGYLQYASVEDEEFYITRGRGSAEFNRSMKSLEEGNLDEAADYLRADISKNSNEGTIFYSHYLLGIAELRSAEKNFLGLFPSYDEVHVKNGIAELHKAIELNNSGRFSNINLDAFYFIGKGYLMLDDKTRASGYFNKVINEKGSRMNEAQKILNDLK